MRLRSIIMAFVLTMLLLGAAWQPFDPNAVNLAMRHGPPSHIHLLGTDQLGRDVLSRLMVGGWRSAVVILIVNAIGYLFGCLLGAGAGLLGGSAENLVLRVAEFTILMPTLIVALTITALVGLNPLTAGIALGLAGVGPNILFTHALTKRIMAQPFFMAARGLGASSPHLIFRHVLPNVTPLLSTRLGSDAGAAIIAYASLAFLGIGSDTSQPDWGAMLFEYRSFAFDDPLLLLWPGAAIALTALLLNWSFDES